MASHDRYQLLRAQYDGHTTNASTYTTLIAELHTYLNGEMPLDKAPAFLARLQTAVGDEFDKALAQARNLEGEGGGDVGGVGGALSVLTRLRDAETNSANDLLEPLFFADPQRFEAEFGTGATDLQAREAPGGAGAAEPFSFKFLPNGSIFRTNNATGAIEHLGTFPEAATQGGVAPQIMQDDRGNLVAINPSTGQVRTLIEGFGFAQIDPERRFALEALQTDVAFKGLELTARGQEIQAIGQDLASRILLGRATFEEAQLELNRINVAGQVRQQEREVALSFAVKSTSIRTLPSGERVTLLPFGQEIADTVGVDVSNFELPVGSVNPNAAAQAVLEASAFDSPIPGLQQAADEASSSIDTILSEPLEGIA